MFQKKPSTNIPPSQPISIPFQSSALELPLSLSPSSSPSPSTSPSRSFSRSPSPSTSPPPSPYLERLPNEILLKIFESLDVQALLSLCTLNPRFQTLAYIVLACRLSSENDLRLRLFIDQENRWRFTVDLKLKHADPATGKFTFVPVQPVACRVYSSAMLRKPTLYKMALVGRDMVGLADHPGQFHIRPTTLSIKTHGEHHQDHVTSHVGTPSSVAWSFDYHVHPTPKDIKKQRSGERWMTPLSLECPLVAFFSEKPTNSLYNFFQGRRIRDEVKPKTTVPAKCDKELRPFAQLHDDYFSSHEINTR